MLVVESIRTATVQKKKYKVLDRTEMDTILKEVTFQLDLVPYWGSLSIKTTPQEHRLQRIAILNDTFVLNDNT